MERRFAFEIIKKRITRATFYHLRCSHEEGPAVLRDDQPYPTAVSPGARQTDRLRGERG